jgi:predicted enzyme related to lactoylglutathione lyase
MESSSTSLCALRSTARVADVRTIPELLLYSGDIHNTSNMLTDSKVWATIPVTDIERAKKFYTETLGLKLKMEAKEMGVAIFSAGGGTEMQLYVRPPSKADHTLATFEVAGIDSEVKTLKDKGVKFEEFEMGGMKMLNSVMKVMGERAAWFRDSEGNILCLHEAV